MRVTNNMLANNMLTQINKNLTRMEKYQNQLATGKKIQNPSDDPVVAARSLKLRTDVSQLNQYQSNAKDAKSWLDITESTLGEIGDVLQRARELAVQSSNGTKTSGDTQKTCEEVKQLKNQLVHLANTTYAGRYIFSGFTTDKPLMDNNGNFAINVTTATENINYEVGVGDAININVTGGDLFNSGGNAATGTAGALISKFDTYINDLNTGNNAGLQNDITNMNDEINNVLRIRADVGARQNRIDLTTNRLDSDTQNFTELMSNNEDVDMAEAIMNLKNEENVYKSSLSGGARVIEPTLLDFLK